MKTTKIVVVTALVCWLLVATMHGGASGKEEETRGGAEELATETISTEYYMFALQKCNTSAPWTIHGLWPQWALCCPGPAFSLSAISSIESQMNEYWPSCPQYSSTNAELWSHEWQKHGTCTGLSELAYFTQALNMLQKYSSGCSPKGSTSCRECFTSSFVQTSFSNCNTNTSFPDCPN